MKYELRKYQKEASDAAVRFFNSKEKRNGIIIAPTGAGKSLIIADIASQLNGNVIVLQPSKEILEQNYMKLKSYGVEDCSIYSASLRQKNISRITFATIGSIIHHLEDFSQFKAVIIDECHLVNSQSGMYKTFIESVQRKVLGLTATPYRLYSQEGITVGGEFKPNGSYKVDDYFMQGVFPMCGVELDSKCILKFLTRTRPRVFHDVIYNIGIDSLVRDGYLALLKYYSIPMIDTSRVKRNSTGRDFDEGSLVNEYNRSDLYSGLVNVVRRLLNPKNGVKRKGILVFTQFVEESRFLCDNVEGCCMLTGETPMKERERIIDAFKEGEISVLSNVGVLTTGFDFPALDTVVMARPTMSLALWYQCVGRAIRPYEGKDGWIVDLGGNIERFGRVDNLFMEMPRSGEYVISGVVKGQRKYLTNIYY